MALCAYRYGRRACQNRSCRDYSYLCAMENNGFGKKKEDIKYEKNRLATGLAATSLTGRATFLPGLGGGFFFSRRRRPSFDFQIRFRRSILRRRL